jgi:hypothetical protein
MAPGYLPMTMRTLEIAADPAAASGWSDCGGAMDRSGRGHWQVGRGSLLFSFYFASRGAGAGDIKTA